MKHRYLYALFIIAAVLVSCAGKKGDYKEFFKNPRLFSSTVSGVTDVITFDIFNPPVASRIYAYSSIAAYEVMSAGTDEYKSLNILLPGLGAIPPPAKEINYELGSLLAYLNVAQQLTFSKDSTQKLIDRMLVVAGEHGMPEDMIRNTVEYSRQVSDTVLKFSKSDNYAQTRTDVKYTVSTEEGRWVPTPPAYMKAVEPNWMKIRTVMIDSASQFQSPPPPPFNKDKSSRFYQMVNEVYVAGNELTDEQRAMADFWDCNGFKLHLSGHVMFATKAMTPGGHWMGITGIVCGNQNADFNKTVFTFTGVSFALMDGFISCWSTKFKYNLVRPETYINLYIDNSWQPYLQTPPFPEYTSGHSVISSASATVLEKILGDETSFRDTTERRWGWPDRDFGSVSEAANEAAISRMYGGIHYNEAINAGMKEGHEIGNMVYTKLAGLLKD